jgi:archaellum biogenesis ATPase FlaH
MTKVVLINGKKRSGKNHLAERLSSELNDSGYSTEIMAFADPIKDIIRTALDISSEELDMYKNNDEHLGIIEVGMYNDEFQFLVSFRVLLQKFGTEAMKKYFGEDVWVNILKTRAQNSDADVVLVPDFRFLSESISNLSINIFNNNLFEHDSHRSENDLNDFKFSKYVDNTGKPDLSEKVKELANWIIESN